LGVLEHRPHVLCLPYKDHAGKGFAMGQVLQFPRRQNIFFPETTQAMGSAFDTAIVSLREDAASELFVRDLVAKRIIKMARRGEVDRERLCKSAISGFVKSRRPA